MIKFILTCCLVLTTSLSWAESRILGDLYIDGAKSCSTVSTNSDGKVACGSAAASSLTDLTDVNTATATAGNLLIADGTDWESVTVGGDATIAKNGIITINSNAIALTDLSDVNTATATSGNLLVADGTDWESVSIQDAVLSSSGAFALEKKASDPCGSKPEGYVFYNDTSNYYCYCDGTNDVLIHNPLLACF